MSSIQKQTEVSKEVEVVFDAAAYVKQHVTKSGAIRALTVEGKSRSEIAKMLKIRYQHVRNVLITPIKKAK